jgi:hypothetical protein
MLKHFVPALAVAALLAGSTSAFAADSASANPTQAAPAGQSATADATTPKVTKSKLHHTKKKKPTTVSAKKKAAPADRTPATSDSATKTN